MGATYPGFSVSKTILTILICTNLNPILNFLFIKPMESSTISYDQQ